MPIFFASNSSAKNFTVFGIASGCVSTVPVTLPPGFSIESISSAPTASVTDVNKVGISDVAAATACADGVAFVKITSGAAATKLFAAVVLILASPCAFSS